MARNRRRRARRRAAARGLRRVAATVVVTAVVVGLAVGAVAQVGPASRPFRRDIDRSFAALASPVAARSTATGAALRQAVAAAPGDDRTALFGALDSAAAAAAAEADDLAGTTPPAPPAAAACQRALDQRHQVAVAVQAGLEGVVGGRTGAAPVPLGTVQAELAGIGTQLAAADGQWAACRRALRAAAGHPQLPASVWDVPAVDWTPGALGSAAAAVAAAPGLAPQHSLAVSAVTTVPAAASDAGGVAVVPPTSSVAVQAVVRDAGNVDEPAVRLTVTLTGPGAPAPARRTLSVAAGTAAAVSVGGLRVTPGGTYQLTVVAAGADPAAGAQVTVPFTVTPEPTFALVTASANPVTTGTRVTFTATMTTPSGQVTGAVAFDDGGTPLAACAAAPVVDGTARCTVADLAPGVHPITAVYAGGGRLAGTVSPPVNETVTARHATTTSARG